MRGLPNQMNKKTITIIGSGPAALMLAARLDEYKFEINILEKGAAPGRKFLVAGDGGLNLTHSEPIQDFIGRYTPPEFLADSLKSFTNDDLRKWFNTIGIETFIGTSKRVFPKEGLRPIDVLNAILKVIRYKSAPIKPKNTWKGWNENNQLIIDHNYKDHTVTSDIVVFAMGGASWSSTGSDGKWLSIFADKGIDTVNFQASNCAFAIEWEPGFIDVFEGSPLKNIAVQCGSKQKKGEVVITQFGIEGGAVYALSPEIRKQLNDTQKATIYLDLKPSLSVAEIKKRLTPKGKKSLTALLTEALHLPKPEIALLKSILSKEEFINPNILAAKIKQLPIIINALAPIEDAISTSGGIALHEVDEHFQLKKIPNQYAIGEMLDWDAPTGGYLLQGSFSMGVALANYLNAL